LQTHYLLCVPNSSLLTEIKIGYIKKSFRKIQLFLIVQRMLVYQRHFWESVLVPVSGIRMPKKKVSNLAYSKTVANKRHVTTCM